MLTRRRFLGLAAVAPLAALGTRVPEPAQTVELKAATDAVVTPMRSPRLPGDTDLSRRCVACDFRAPWSNESTSERATQEYRLLLQHFDDAHGGVVQNTEVNWRPHVTPSGSFNTSDRLTVTGASRIEPQPYVYRVENGIGFYSSDPANQRTVIGNPALASLLDSGKKAGLIS